MHAFENEIAVLYWIVLFCDLFYYLKAYCIVTFSCEKFFMKNSLPTQFFNPLKYCMDF